MAVALPAYAGSPTSPYIVSDTAAVDASQAIADVAAVGGQVDEPLSAADGVLADLSVPQVKALQQLPTVTVTPDVTVDMAAMPSTSSPSTAGGRAPAAVFPQQTGATQLWARGDSGAGVNVAVLDTGIDALPDFAGRLLPGVDLSGEGNPNLDSYGHGTFVAGLIAGGGASSGGLYKGEAPAAGVIPVKVAGSSGSTDLATVVEGIDWVIAHRSAENIQVLNLSLGSVPTQSTITDPLDQAVERAWESGITVVAAAGNSGPFNGTVLSPGDDPLIITAGAVDDQGSTTTTNDTMAPYSSVGPTTPDGSFKPDLVTSGTSVVSLRAPGSTVDTQNPGARVGTGNFVGSGTSFSSAITSGAVALYLAAHPKTAPNDVKAALLGTTSAGPVGNPFVDGHGLLNAAAAVSSGGLRLTQSFGQTLVSSPTPPNVSLSPGSTLRAGYSLQMSGRHPDASAWLSGGELQLPISCQQNGTAVGDVTIDEVPAVYPIQANSNASVPSGTALQGTTTVPDLCSGAPLYVTGAQGGGAMFTGSVISSDTTDPVQLRVQAQFGQQLTNLGGATVVPAATPQPDASVSLASTWATSSWNPAQWAGLKTGPGSGPISTTGSASSIGSAWDGSNWAGSAWTGSAWTGSKWTGSAWTGSKWTGSAWTGSKWTGSAWTGSKWTGNGWGPLDGSSTGTASTPPSTSGSSGYPGYQLVSTNPDLWCPQGANLGHPGTAGHAGNGTQGAAGGVGGQPGCGSNGGNGGNGGTSAPSGDRGGIGGSGGDGGCVPATDAQMAQGQYPCNGSGSNGGNGGNGGNAVSGHGGGAGGNGGAGGDAANAPGGTGGNGGNAQPSLAGGPGGDGGQGGGCALYSASYWVTCPANGGHGGNGGQGAAGARGGAGGNGGMAGTALNTAGGNGSNGGDGHAGGGDGSAGQNGTPGGTTRTG